MRSVAIAFCLFVLWSGSQVRGAEPGKQQAELVEVKVSIQYLLHLPKSYGEDKSKKWPLIVFLHGSGERGGDVNLVKVHGPPKLVEKDADFPFIVVSPQCPVDNRWTPQLLSKMLDDVLAKNSVDQDRIYLTGLSMGGAGTWDWAAAEPHRFAALVPICGGGGGRIAEKIKHIPTWVFHGAKDTGVSISSSLDMVSTFGLDRRLRLKSSSYDYVACKRRPLSERTSCAVSRESPGRLTRLPSINLCWCG